MLTTDGESNSLDSVVLDLLGGHLRAQRTGDARGYYSGQEQPGSDHNYVRDDISILMEVRRPLLIEGVWR